MTRTIPATAVKLAAALIATTAALAALAAGAGATNTIIYDNIPAPLPGNAVSQPFEAAQMSEFGGQVEFSATSQKTTNVTVAMSSWACQTGTKANHNCVTERGAKFEWPVTLNIYTVEAANKVGNRVVTVTKTFKMPYRPSSSPRCTGELAGDWFGKGECWSGRLFKITFPLGRVFLPSRAIISVSYNTSDYGSEPQRPKPCNSTEAGCPYDSLNVGLTEPKLNAKEEPEGPVPPSVGSDPAPEDAYHNSLTAENYCDKGLQGTGTFRLDSGPPPCWTGYQPLFEVITKS